MPKRRNVSGWKSRPAEKELKSGAVVVIRRVSLSALMAMGQVPQAFFNALEGAGANTARQPAGRPAPRPGTVGYRPAQAAATMAARGGTIDPAKMDAAELKELTAFARLIARGVPGEKPVDPPQVAGALVWPKVVDDPAAALAEARRRDPEAAEDDFVHIDEIPLEDLFEIMAHAINSAAVATEDGEVSAEALTKNPPVEDVQGDRERVEDVRAASG